MGFVRAASHVIRPEPAPHPRSTHKLDFDHLKAIYEAGYTRVPVYQDKRENIVGVLFTKASLLDLAVTHRYMPLHAVTCRYIPLHTVAYRYTPSSAPRT